MINDSVAKHLFKNQEFKVNSYINFLLIYYIIKSYNYLIIPNVLILLFCGLNIKYITIFSVHLKLNFHLFYIF